jgi:hypothetical protein
MNKEDNKKLFPNNGEVNFDKIFQPMRDRQKSNWKLSQTIINNLTKTLANTNNKN